MMPRTWLITGSSRGLGRALGEAVIEAGDNLVPTARDAGTLADLVPRGGGRVLAAPLDVTDANAALSAVALAVSRFRGLDIVVNNTGYGDVTPIEDTSIDDFRAQIETNLFGTIIVTKAEIPLFRERRAGRFIQISSIGGPVGAMGRGPYCTAKFGVEGFSEVLAGELASFGCTSPSSSLVASAPTSQAPQQEARKKILHMPKRLARRRRCSGHMTGASLEIPQRRPGRSWRWRAQRRRPCDLCSVATLTRAEHNDEARLAELRAWRTTSVSTDFGTERAS
jgi:NAD(P)-dependent dehydrogenase (short-subunit alcohol dehydrogenase family)